MSTVTGANTSATGRLLDELAGLLLPVVMPLVRRLPAMILVLAGLISLMGVLVLVGAHRDDAEIRAHSAVATAEVLPGSDFSRTLIAFTTAKGETVSPERGVFYPRGLQPGQIVRVEYDSTHPDRVRVLGRDASVGSLPIGLMLLVTWAIALPVGFSLRGRQLRRMEADRLAASIAEATAAATGGSSAASAGKAAKAGGAAVGEPGDAARDTPEPGAPEPASAGAVAGASEPVDAGAGAGASGAETSGGDRVSVDPAGERSPAKSPSTDAA
ncbi:MAG TPA: DUF3592 domain-containing protein [Pseudonocardia sp.]|jgi:hypothetical protein|nr:DUF3592 domain-containing protein [Pseudonocardia sp.]